MRIADFSQNDWIRSTLTGNRNNLQDLQRQASTGKAYQARSDAPVEAAQADRISAIIANSDTWKKNVDYATTISQTTDTYVAQLMEYIQSAQEVATTAGDATFTPTDRKNLAISINNVLESYTQIGNFKNGDMYLFGGTDSATPPITVTRDAKNQIITATVTTGEKRTIQTGDNSTMTYGARASGYPDGVFVIPDPNGGPDQINALNTLIQLRDQLNAGNQPTATQISQLKAIQDNIAARQIETGVDQSRLQSLQTNLLQGQDAQNTALSKLQTADMANILTQLAQMESVMTASMQMAGRINKLNLMDYI